MSGFVVLGLISCIPTYVICWEERFQNDLFFVPDGVLNINSINQLLRSVI